MVDLDRSGRGFQQSRVWLGPSLGWTMEQVQPSTLILVPGTYTVKPGDSLILVNVAGPVTILLPDISTWIQQPASQPATAFDRSIAVKDKGGNAANFNISINPFGTQQIDGANQPVKITANGGAIQLVPLVDLSGWIVQVGTAGGGGGGGAVDVYSQIINVKDHGAVGDGATNDTAAIQSAFDLAFGPRTAPHGTVGTLNRPVYFPGGRYRVATPRTATVSGAVNNGSGLLRLTVNSTSGWITGDPATLSGIGGITLIGNPLNHVYLTVVDGQHFDVMGWSFTGTYTSGGVVNSPCLILKDVLGGHIFGAGNQATVLDNSGAVCPIIQTVGCSSSRFEDFTLVGDQSKSVVGNVCFQLDANGFSPGTVALTGNTFVNISFTGYEGINIGYGQFMGSENRFYGCTWAGCFDGLLTWNFNAIENSILGGASAENAGHGIRCITGTIATIVGLSSSNNGISDISIETGTCAVSGCRSESTSFIDQFTGGTISACDHRGTGPFANNFVGNTTIDGCVSGGPIAGPTGVQGAVVATDSSFGVRSGVSRSQVAHYDQSKLTLIDCFAGQGNPSVTGLLMSRYARKVIRGGHMGSQIYDPRTYDVEAATLTDDQFLYETATIQGTGAGIAVTVTIASPAVFTYPQHGLDVDTPVAFITTGALPTGLSPNTTYYVISAGLAQNTFEVSTSVGGAAVNTSGTQSGSHFVNVLRVYAVGDQIAKSNVVAGGSPGWVCTTAGNGLTGVFRAMANVA